MSCERVDDRTVGEEGSRGEISKGLLEGGIETEKRSECWGCKAFLSKG